MNPSTQNQRKFPRYAIEATVTYQTQKGTTQSQVQNLSLGGVCIHCEEAEEIGKQINLTLSFPEQEGTVSIPSEVIWVNRQSPKEMGLRFLSLTQQQLHWLQSCLKKIYAAMDFEETPSALV